MKSRLPFGSFSILKGSSGASPSAPLPGASAHHSASTESMSFVISLTLKVNTECFISPSSYWLNSAPVTIPVGSPSVLILSALPFISWNGFSSSSTSPPSSIIEASIVPIPMSIKKEPLPSSFIVYSSAYSKQPDKRSITASEKSTTTVEPKNDLRITPSRTKITKRYCSRLREWGGASLHSWMKCNRLGALGL